MTRIALALALVLAACGGSSTTDAGLDAGGDAGVDLGGDLGADLGVDAGPTASVYVYVGLGSGDLVTLDAVTLAELHRTHVGMFPSFVAPSPDGAYLYAVDETDDEVVALSVARDGTTTVLNRQPAPSDPAHVSVDAAGAFAFTASYGSGEVRSFPILPDGTLGAVADTDTAGLHAHEAVPAPGGLLYVPCLGADIVVLYSVDATGALTRRVMASTNAGAGPRHLAFSPDRMFAYVIDELSSSVDVYSVNAIDGGLTRVQTITTLPTGFTGMNAAAEILLSADGRFVYGSNRGVDDVVVYTRSATTGRLTLLQHVSAGGMHPRSMALTQAGARMLVADRDSNLIAAFEVSTDGMLSPHITVPMPGMPYFVAEYSAPH